MLKGCTPWPADLAARYRAAGYWQGERLGDVTRRRAAETPSRVAVVAGARRITYAELDTRAARLAAGLAQLGIGMHDRVVVQLPNVPAFLKVTLALFRIGALPVFALPQHRSNEINYFCAHAQAVAYVVPDVLQGFDYRTLARDTRNAVPSLRHVIVAGDPGEFLALDAIDAEPASLPEPDPSDVAFFLLSGGTTSLPKLIPRTHDDYAYQLRATAAALGFDERGVYLASLPMAHNAALGCPGVLGTLRAGGRVVLAPTPSPDDAFPLLASEGVTLTTLVPSLVNLWVEAAEWLEVDFSRVLLQVGGAMLNRNTARTLVGPLGGRLTHWFGMAEGLLSFTRLDDPEDVVIGTQGRPLCPDDEIRVVDEADRNVAPGETGELLTRGPYTLRGYYDAAAHNAVTFTSTGFLRTGDLVRISERGDMSVEGRIKDVINRGGEKVPAEEVETHLLTHPDVRNAAVVAVPDALLGEKTCAFLVTSRGVTLREIRDFLGARGMADYKLPDRIELLDALPSTNVGKINKVALRASLARANE